MIESSILSSMINCQFNRPSSIATLQLVYGPGFFVHVIHEHITAQRPRRCEVRFAVADLGDLSHETDEIVVAREHERVDENPCLAACGDFRERFGHDERVEAEGVAIDAAVS